MIARRRQRNSKKRIGNHHPITKILFANRIINKTITLSIQHIENELCYLKLTKYKKM